MPARVGPKRSTRSADLLFAGAPMWLPPAVSAVARLVLLVAIASVLVYVVVALVRSTGDLQRSALAVAGAALLLAADAWSISGAASSRTTRLTGGVRPCWRPSSVLT